MAKTQRRQPVYHGKKRLACHGCRHVHLTLIEENNPVLLTSDTCIRGKYLLENTFDTCGPVHSGNLLSAS